MKTSYKHSFTALIAVLLAMLCMAMPTFAAEEKSSADYNDAQLSALVNFFQFEIVLEDEETKVQNYEYAEVPLDLSKPWEYPGIVWNDTKPYSVLSIDLTAYPKLSGKLDLSSMVKLKQVDVSGTEIEWVVLGENSELIDFRSENSTVLSLNFSKCTRIENIDCSDSAIQQLLLPEHRLESLDCSGNLLTYATLPPLNCAKEYGYAPQKNAFFLGIGGINSLELGRKADMTSYLADNIEWFYADGTPITEYTVEEQKYDFTNLQLEDRIYAVMTSDAYPELTLTTEPITIVKNSQAMVWMFFGAVIFTFVLFFSVRYLNAKKRGDELLTDKYTDKLSEKYDRFIANISDKLHRKK